MIVEEGEVNREEDEVRRWDDSWRRRWRARSFFRWCVSEEGVDVEVGGVGLVVVVFLMVVDEGGFVV